MSHDETQERHGRHALACPTPHTDLARLFRHGWLR